MNRVEEYLSEIRSCDGLKNAILYGLTVTKRDKSVEFSLITDKTYTETEAHLAQIVSQKYLPDGFTAKMKIIKRVPDKETLKSKIFQYVTVKYPAAAAFLDERYIEIEMLDSGAHFCFDIA